MPLPSLRYFHPSEFKRPDLVDEQAALFLDEVRHRFGFPLRITSDARIRGTPQPGGAAENSLHYAGRAFDLQWIAPSHRLWHLVEVLMEIAAEWQVCVELELVNGLHDAHVHFGLQPPGIASELIVAAD